MTNDKYLVVNGGSSSLKFSLYEVPEMKEIVNVLVEQIGESDSSYTLKYDSKKETGICLFRSCSVHFVYFHSLSADSLCSRGYFGFPEIHA